MKKRAVRIFFLLVLIATTSAIPLSSGERYGAPVDIVFCLDLSGSTNGIVDRLRNHLWDYVNLLSNTFPKTDFRIGFVGFARPSFGKDNYYVKVIQDLTHDIEGLSHEMFKLRSQIEKGDQYVSAALNVCSKNVSWSTRTDAIKIVFLGGNGLVTTGGGEHYSKVVEAMVQQGIIVNSIYLLNNSGMGEQKGWEDIATRGKGKYTSMQVKFEYYENLGGFDMNKLFNLNRKLNDTYLYYGERGKERWIEQRQDDENIYKANSEGYRYRLQFRISDLYLGKNSDWDMIDLHTKDPLAIANIDRASMIDTVKYMTDSDLRAYIIFNKYKRKKIIGDIKQLLADKEKWMKDKNLDADKNMKTFDITTINWLTDVLKAHGYTLMDYK